MKNISGYFDYSASTPLDVRVKKAMEPYFTDYFYNPSSGYSKAREVAVDLKNARAQIASLLGSKPSEIIFTAGATEANNMAIYGVMEKFSQANIVVSAIEHESVLKPAQNYRTKLCPVAKSGIIDLKELEALIDEKTVLVSVMLANNEIGTIQPVKKVAELINQVRQKRIKTGNKLPIYLHSDMAQAGNYLDLHISRLGVDLMSLNGGKIYGPKQSGILFVKTGLVLKPLILGGGQERNLRSGTENIPAIIGFAMALKIANEMREHEVKRLSELQKLFINLLKKHVPNHQINGSLKNRLPNNVHVTFFDQDNERLMILLDELGFCTAVGSACSASSEEPSHVLAALRMSKNDIQMSLRFSMGRLTTTGGVTKLVDAIKTSIHA